MSYVQDYFLDGTSGILVSIMRLSDKPVELKWCHTQPPGKLVFTPHSVYRLKHIHFIVFVLSHVLNLSFPHVSILCDKLTLMEKRRNIM